MLSWKYDRKLKGEFEKFSKIDDWICQISKNFFITFAMLGCFLCYVNFSLDNDNLNNLNFKKSKNSFAFIVRTCS